MFIVYISTENNVEEPRGNSYGYYQGKCYMKYGEHFPITDTTITENTKRYKSEKTALRGVKSLIDKCQYIASYKIEEI